MKKEAKIKFLSVLKLVLWLYLFILSIELIKRSSLFLAKNLSELMSLATSPIKAVSVGWLTTVLAQSSGTVSSIVATFVGNNILPLKIAVFIVMGTLIGTTITSAITSLLTKARKRRDFRHGFEITAAHMIYNVFILVAVFTLEYFFHIFTKIGFFFGRTLEGAVLLKSIPNLIDLICGFLIKIIFLIPNKIFILIFGFLILFLSLNFLTKTILSILGGVERARKTINRYFRSRAKAFLIGMLITAILFSSSITISLLVPLAVARLVNLKKALPFIIGAEIGTGTDTILAALVTGKAFAVSVALIYLLLGVIGAIIWLPNIKIIFKTTKYFSKKLLHVSRKKALFYLIVFILIPIILLAL